MASFLFFWNTTPFFADSLDSSLRIISLMLHSNTPAPRLRKVS